MAVKLYEWRDAEFQNMVKVVEELQEITHGTFKVGTTWLDFGQGLCWTTIISKNPSYQVLNPRQQEAICSGDFSCVKELAREWFKLRKMELENELKLIERKEEEL